MSASPIDQLVARRVLELGLVRQEILPALLARATASGRLRGGSLVAAALVDEGHVPAATIDAILRSLAPGGGARSGEWTFAGGGAPARPPAASAEASRPADGTFAPGAPLDSGGATFARRRAGIDGRRAVQVVATAPEPASATSATARRSSYG